MEQRRRRRSGGWIERVVLVTVAVVIAGCASAGAGVTIERSDQSPIETEGPVESTDVDPPEVDSPESTDESTADSPESTDEQTAANDEASGVGDALFPDLGNPGVDVVSYDIELAYDPDTAMIDASVTLSIDATESLAEFTLDQVGLDIDSVLLDGTAVDYEADDPELWIRPERPIAAGTSFTVDVTYSADGSSSSSAAGVSSGWFPTPLGSFTLNEPDGARTWLPSNDHPSDKASYRFAIEVPDGDTGVANGELESSVRTDDGGSVWTWVQSEPMTTYVIQVLTGPYTIVDSAPADGVPLSSAILEGDETLMEPYLDVTPLQIEYFERFFGPYPLDRYGIAMTDEYFGGAMEEQGRSLFSREDFTSGELGHGEELLLAHELAHQWFGNAVAPARWQDIWLNESFASYAEWMWLDHAGHIELAETARSNLELRQDGFVATGDPDAAGLFGYEVYEGGAVVLHALRLTVGDQVFFEILQRWVADNIDTSRTTDDFIATAESISGLQLTSFFDDWLYSTDLPDAFPT